MIIRALLQLLIKIASMVTALLPDHTPIVFPDTGPLWSVFRGLGALDQYVDMTHFFVVIGIVAVYMAAKLIYAGYRVLLGLVPALK